MAERDVVQDFDDAYELAQAGWSQWMGEATKDLQFYQGAQWDANKRAYIEAAGREAWVFNRIRRVIKLVAGYERRNRTILKCTPTGVEDDLVASQHSAVLRNVMKRAYGVLSDCFKYGALVTGANLVNFWPDGDKIRFARNPHTKFRLDPYFTRRDLSDCRFILRREMITHEVAAKLVPASAAGRIKGIADTGADGKYPELATYNVYGEDLLPYDEFWRRVDKKTKMVVDRGMWREYEYETLIDNAMRQRPGVKREDAKNLLERMIDTTPRFTTYENRTETVKLDILYGGKPVWHGEAPYGIDDYNFELVAGDFMPEEKRDGNRIMGIVRAARDPQTADNRRICQLHDIVESNLQAGHIAIASHLVDKDSLYQTGQGRNVYLEDAGDTHKSVRRIQPTDIPPGQFQLENLTGRMVVEVTGANEEALGGGEQKDIPALLSKMRQGAALTIFQEEFDNYNASKVDMGGKLVRMVQWMFKNRPQKVARIINQMPAPNFFDPDITRYDMDVTEGLETDTQRQTAAHHLVYLKSLGSKVGDPAPIPWSAILELSPIELKDVVMRHMKQAEEQNKRMRQAESQSKQTTERMKQAKIAADLGRAAERHAQVEENKAGAMLDRIKALQEIDQFGWDRALALMDRLIAMDKQPAITKR